MKKRGQVTIFIILAIIIVAAVALVLIYVKPSIPGFRNTNIDFESCVQNSLEETLDFSGQNAQLIKNNFSYQYQGQNIPYICYTNNYHETCTVQVPFLKQNVENNLEEQMNLKIQSCYDNSINELKSRGIQVISGEVIYNISIRPNEVAVEIKAPTSIEQSSFKTFNARSNSNLYEMLMISTSILQYETKLGDSDTSSIMLLYPNLIIDKLKQGEGTTIYIITNKLDNTQIKFASRSLAWPAGYDQ